MKNYFVLAFLLTVASPSLLAQDSLVLNKISFRSNISGINGKLEDGFLHQVGHSELAISPQSVRFGVVLPEDASSHRRAP